MPNVLMPSTPMRRRDGGVEGATVDGGRNPANSPVDMVGRLSNYLTWFYTSKRWLGMGFLNHQQYDFMKQLVSTCKKETIYIYTRYIYIYP